ncbi:MAG: TetR family transcriptional regulator [Caulobacterales bacterium]
MNVLTTKPIPATGSFSKAKLKIILAAEKLFASTSIESASLREIALEAGQKNHYAVQYHFGSRDGLVRAVFAHRMFQMEGRREMMLAAAERDDKLHQMRTLLEMLYVPQLELQRAEGNKSYASFLCQYLLRQRSTTFGDFDIPPPPNLARIFDLLKGCVGHLPDGVAQRRLVSGSLVFLNILATYVDEHGEGTDVAGGETFEQALEDSLALIETTLAMPLTKLSAAAKTRRRGR